MISVLNTCQSGLLHQSFTKLLDKLGAPAAPLEAPASIPAPNEAFIAEALGTDVPTLQEVGYTQKPTTIFKVSSLHQM
jgi:hypothetical protein